MKNLIDKLKNAVLAMLINIVLAQLAKLLFPESLSEVGFYESVVILAALFALLYLIIEAVNRARRNKYRFHIVKAEDKLYYDGDYVDVTQSFTVYPICFRRNKMHTEKEWYSDEEFSFDAITEGYGVEEISTTGNKHEYFITFPKFMYFMHKFEFHTNFRGANTKRRFMNFYCKRITAPTDVLYLEVKIPREYVKIGGHAELKKYLKYDGDASSEKEVIEFDGFYRWKVEKPRLEWTYEISWEWAESEKPRV